MYVFTHVQMEGVYDWTILDSNGLPMPEPFFSFITFPVFQNDLSIGDSQPAQLQEKDESTFSLDVKHEKSKPEDSKKAESNEESKPEDSKTIETGVEKTHTETNSFQEPVPVEPVPDTSNVTLSDSIGAVFAGTRSKDNMPQTIKPQPKKRKKKNNQKQKENDEFDDSEEDNTLKEENLEKVDTDEKRNVTASFIREKLKATMKRLQRRIDVKKAIDPLSELERVREELKEFQFTSCSATMMACGLSSPRSTSSIPTPSSNVVDCSLFLLERKTPSSQMVFVSIQVSDVETIRFCLKINKYLANRAPLAAYFEAESFVIPSTNKDSPSQIRVFQKTDDDSISPILCMVGGEVRHAKLKSEQTEFNIDEKKHSEEDEYHDEFKEEEEEEEEKPKKKKRRISKTQSKTFSSSSSSSDPFTPSGLFVSAPKKPKFNCGRPLKMNLICVTGKPIYFRVYHSKGFVPKIGASTKLRSCKDSRQLSENTEFDFHTVSSSSSSPASPDFNLKDFE